MAEWRLFDAGTVPDWTTPGWYAGRDAAPHLEQDGHCQRLLLTAEMAVDALTRAGSGATLCDLGAGDGGLLSLLVAARPELSCWGYDLQATNVQAAADRGVILSLTDVIADWPGAGQRDADVVVAGEFLEHLIDPHELARRIAATSARFLIASSPYTESDTAHYTFHTWAWDLDGYRTLLEDAGWRVLRQETAWISQVCLAERAA